MQAGIPSSLTQGVDGVMMESVAEDCGVGLIDSATREEYFRRWNNSPA